MRLRPTPFPRPVADDRLVEHGPVARASASAAEVGADRARRAVALSHAVRRLRNSSSWAAPERGDADAG